MEERDYGSLELGTLPGVDGGGGEGLPDYVLANVGGDEEGDSGAQAVALLEELVEDDHDEAGEDELEDDEEGVTGTEGAEVAVHSADNVGHGLADGDEDAEELRGRAWVRGCVVELKFVPWSECWTPSILLPTPTKLTFWAPEKSALSSLTCWLTSMSLDPAASCMTSPEVTMGEIPSSMRVPRLEARMTRIQ